MANGIFGELSFKSIKDQIDNLSPEQAQGLLAFGANLLRRPEFGETLGSQIATGAQAGFQTTAALRAQKAAAEAAAEKAAREQAKLDIETAKERREQKEFEERDDPRRALSKIDISKMTPESVREFLKTGDHSVLRFNPATRSSVNVSVGGEIPFKTSPGEIAVIRNPDGTTRALTAAEIESGNFDPNALEIQPIPGSAKSKLTPEQAAKAQLIQGALDNYSELSGLFVSPDGDVNRTNIANMVAGTPFTQGRSANVLLKDTIEAKLRAESGAAVPESEVKRIAERLQPSLFDSDATVKLKMRLIEQFLQGTYDKFDPTGVFLRKDTTRRFEKDIEATLNFKPAKVTPVEAPKRILARQLGDLTDDELDNLSLDQLRELEAELRK